MSPLAALCSLLVLAPTSGPSPQAGGDTVWIEGEKPSQANVRFSVAGWGHKEFLSQQAWLQLSVDGENVDRDVPPDGAVFGYDFQTASGGKREIWDRIGYEFARSPFDWRVDGGAWTRVSPDALTTDLMGLADWNEVAWLKLGERDLASGAHRLEIRLPRTANAKGQRERILYASDAIAITDRPFRPNGSFKPGEDGRTDADRAAERHVFRLFGAGAGESDLVSFSLSPELKGTWEIAREDEEIPAPVASPMKPPGEGLAFHAISVPSDKNEARPDLTLAHRLWYRTRVEIPKWMAKNSFQIKFPQNNLNTTLYVNGQYCGFSKNPLAAFTLDVTKAIHPGTNEILVGIRDAWYGYSANPKDPMKLRRKFNVPLSFTQGGFQDLAYPVWHAFQSGLLEAPIVTIHGAVYATDVFPQPSVARKSLRTDVTVTNTTDAKANVSVLVEALPMTPKGGGTQEFSSASPSVVLAPGETRMISVEGAWPRPRLWWPGDPAMYSLRATVNVDGKQEDVQMVPLGFREWSIRGKDLLLNGTPWHGWAELTQGDTPSEWLKNYRAHGQRFMRLAGNAQNGGPRWKGLGWDEALSFFDQNGVVVRRSNVLDGEAIGYMAVENDPDLRAKYGTEIKQELIDNWRDQMVQQVKAERNHPSIGLWSIENEWLYINCINLYGGLMDAFEREELRTGQAVAAVDPTRPWMPDGGGSGKANLFPVHGDHYIFSGDTEPGRYPDLAYQANPSGAGRGRWTWDGNRPRYAGEDFYAAGINPANYAWIGGERAFQGKVAAQEAIAKVQRMLNEGYRWGGTMTAWHLWVGDEGAKYHDKYVANAPLAAFVRQYDWTFGSGETVRRTVGIFNDTHDPRPVDFAWSLSVGGKRVAKGTRRMGVPPGKSLKFDLALPMPPAAARTQGTLTLDLSVGGAHRFHDDKPLAVLPAPFTKAPKWSGLGLFDPAGKVNAFLTAHHIPFIRVDHLAAIPAAVRTLVVGPDALNEVESVSTELSAWTFGGKRAIVLDQAHPLHYQALPADVASESNAGSFAFPEDLTHPAFRGLGSGDFVGWESDGKVYRNAYKKPERGAKSLIQCDRQLGSSALLEVPVGPGLLLLCQAKVGSDLKESAVAQRLLANLIDYAEAYRLEFRPVTAAVDASFGKVLDAVGVKRTDVDDPLRAIAAPGIAIVGASPANLHSLATNLPKVRAFTKAGGSLILHGLTPEGLADYNRIVGVDHMIRPFRREKVTWPAQRPSITAGLTLGDIVLYSSEKMFGYNDDRFVAGDTFSYVVDFDDVAPFAKLPNDSFYNTVNGLVSADSWKYIFSFDLDHQKPEMTLNWPRPQRLTEFEWIGNAFYHRVTKVRLEMGTKAVSLATRPDDSVQTFPLDLGGKSLRLAITDYQRVPSATANVVGIDNIRLRAARPASFYARVHPLTNVGGMMLYDEGAGNILLVNLNFPDQEDVPANGARKRNVLATLLRNLKAPFATGKTVIAGARLDYSPIDLREKANAYRTERGWFGDSARSFKDIPTGNQRFALIPFSIYEFPTSPVPTAVMLGGPGVPGNLPDGVTGIPVRRKADALFFLQTARLDVRRNEQERRAGKVFEMARYVVHYADGQTVAVPIRAELDVDDYRQKAPASLPGAALGWSRKYENSDVSATAWVQQWNNPRPDVEIASVDLVYGPDRRGVPALLAVTAASASASPSAVARSPRISIERK